MMKLNASGLTKLCQSDMDADICQAITTELTIHGTKGGSGKTNVPWTNFYNMSVIKW
jgi:hypothetical protein